MSMATNTIAAFIWGDTTVLDIDNNTTNDNNDIDSNDSDMIRSASSSSSSLIVNKKPLWSFCPCFRPRPVYMNNYIVGHKKSLLKHDMINDDDDSDTEETYSDSESDDFSDDNDNYQIEECNNNTLRRSKSVQFSTIQIREYELIIGDHYTNKPYPISLDWSYSDSNINYNIDDHIETRTKQKNEREYYSNIDYDNNNRSSMNKVSNTSQFRLNETSRFLRICNVSTLSKNELINIENVRLIKYHENKRRSAIGLPLID